MYSIMGPKTLFYLLRPLLCLQVATCGTACTRPNLQYYVMIIPTILTKPPGNSAVGFRV